MLRYKLKYTGKAISFNVPLKSGNIDYIDYKQDHENEFSNEKTNSVNPILDGDVVRFKPTEIVSQLQVSFNGSNSYLNAGFISDDIVSLSDSFVHSNYVIQVYDTPDSSKQSLLHTGYINGYDILTSEVSEHSLILSMESYAIYLPKSFLDGVTDTFTLYFKFLFYNAKSGTLISFTKNVSSLSNENELYFPFVFTKSTRRYSFPSTIVLKQLPTSAYTDIVNETITSIRLEKPTYPIGNNFTVDGKYENID